MASGTLPPSSQNGLTTRSATNRLKEAKHKNRAESIEEEIAVLYSKGLLTSQREPTFSDVLGVLEIMVKEKKLVATEGGNAIMAVVSMMRKIKEDELVEGVAKKVLYSLSSTLQQNHPTTSHLDTKLTEMKTDVINTIHSLAVACEEGFIAIDKKFATLKSRPTAPPASQTRSFAQVVAGVYILGQQLPEINQARIKAQVEICCRQVKFILANNEAGRNLATIDTRQLVGKLNNTLEAINALVAVRFIMATKMKDSRSLLTEMVSSAAAEWLTTLKNKSAFHAKLEGAMVLNQKLSQVLVKFAPVDFNADQDVNL
ncbi:hypothetical protein PQX77_008152 [Marasmius sp. AFHP31]|nr:hypothetical protein PQX77_008152 [Marasmius sp. AFHP31]